MIGRAAQGNPWIFREIDHFLRTGKALDPPSASEVGSILHQHLRALHAFYGPYLGVRVARKHLSWYCKGRPGAAAFWQRINRVECATTQLRLVEDYFDALAQSPQSWERAA